MHRHIDICWFCTFLWVFESMQNGFIPDSLLFGEQQQGVADADDVTVGEDGLAMDPPTVDIDSILTGHIINRVSASRRIEVDLEVFARDSLVKYLK